MLVPVMPVDCIVCIRQTLKTEFNSTNKLNTTFIDSEAVRISPGQLVIIKQKKVIFSTEFIIANIFALIFRTKCKWSYVTRTKLLFTLLK